jgi:hypothetical protein
LSIIAIAIVFAVIVAACIGVVAGISARSRAERRRIAAPYLAAFDAQWLAGEEQLQRSQAIIDAHVEAARQASRSGATKPAKGARGEP